MSDDDAATGFTLLGSTGELHHADLERYYAYPDNLDRCWVRANMIASLDGGATVKGRAGGLAGPGDRALFKVMRDLADVVLVGAGTVRAENYSGAQLSVTARQSRQARGQHEVPPIAVVTASGALEPESRLFTRTDTPPLVFTANATASPTRNLLHDRAEVLDASTRDPLTVDPAAVLSELARRGLRRVLCEGGPMLLGDIVELGLLDELGLTIAPMLVDGAAPRICAGSRQMTTGMRATHVMTDEDGYLYLRYTRAR